MTETTITENSLENEFNIILNLLRFMDKLGKINSKFVNFEKMKEYTIRLEYLKMEIQRMKEGNHIF